jgi:hypothetical protein
MRNHDYKRRDHVNLPFKLGLAALKTTRVGGPRPRIDDPSLGFGDIGPISNDIYIGPPRRSRGQPIKKLAPIEGSEHRPNRKGVGN